MEKNERKYISLPQEVISLVIFQNNAKSAWVIKILFPWSASWEVLFVFLLSEKSLWIFKNNGCQIPWSILFTVQTNFENKRQPSCIGLGVRRFSFFQWRQLPLGAEIESGRRTDQFYLDSHLISHLILSCIHSIHWKARALFNMTQR